jgi:4-diphosphocytidyl-2-C-methyl-D-erythritol kinase
MTRAKAYAKINLGLVVGRRRSDGMHEVATVLQRIDLHDDVALGPSDTLVVGGYAEDTIVREALESLARAARVEPRWRVYVEKRIPVASGLGGGSSDAATALRLANATLPTPLPLDALASVAAEVGADVPFFLQEGAQLATGDGTEVAAIELPRDYHVVLVAPDDETKESTQVVYEAFDARGGAAGFEDRAAALHRALAAIGTARDLALLPANDLASSPIADELEAAGAFRADVSGAGPTVYGLFEGALDTEAAATALAKRGQAFVTRPVGAASLPGVAR